MTAAEAGREISQLREQYNIALTIVARDRVEGKLTALEHTYADANLEERYMPAIRTRVDVIRKSEFYVKETP